MGRLIEVTRSHGPQHFGIARYATVAEAVSNGTWWLRRGHLYQLVIETIYQHSPPNPDTEDDIWLWRHSESEYRNYFSGKETWNQLRSRRDR